jgi:hypothetical protein
MKLLLLLLFPAFAFGQVPSSSPRNNVRSFSRDGATAAPGTAPPATSQTIVSAEGTWSFGSIRNGGGYSLLLNGQPAGITNFGMLYEYKSRKVWNRNAEGQWYLWNGNDFVHSGSPR